MTLGKPHTNVLQKESRLNSKAVEDRFRLQFINLGFSRHNRHILRKLFANFFNTNELSVPKLIQNKNWCLLSSNDNSSDRRLTYNPEGSQKDNCAPRQSLCRAVSPGDRIRKTPHDEEWHLQKRIFNKMLEKKIRKLQATNRPLP